MLNKNERSSAKINRRFIFVFLGLFLFASTAGARIISASGSATLVTNIQFSSSTFSASESTSAVVTVTRTGDTSITSSVTFSTVAGGSAVGGACGSADYATTSQTVNFAVGETSKNVNVTVCSDIGGEATETVNLALTAPSAGTTLGSPSTAVLSIRDVASQFRNSTPITVNTGSIANPYPSSITVSGVPTSFARIRVTLFDFVPTPGNHVDVLLVGPNGVSYVLMAHVGVPNPPAGPVTLTFLDSALAVLRTNVPLTTGTFLPTSCDEVGSFDPPAPQLPYVIPGCDVDRVISETLFGAFGSSNPNGLWRLYVREDEVATGSVAATILGGWGIEFVSVTAADAIISGRVTSEDGNGIRGARVTMVDSHGVARSVMTSSLGYYQFEEVETGESYLLGVSSRRYRFENRLVQVVDSLHEVNFVGIE
jgi:hypothetical protein